MSLWSPPAPAQITRLQVSNGGTTDSLQTQWERPPGELDSYRVLLVHDSSIIKNESVEADATGISFHALKPGALYKVVVTTIRAAQSSRQTVAEGCTGKTGGGSAAYKLVWAQRGEGSEPVLRVCRILLKSRHLSGIFRKCRQ